MPTFHGFEQDLADCSDRQIELLEQLIDSLQCLLKDSEHNLTTRLVRVRHDMARQVLGLLRDLNHSTECRRLPHQLQQLLINLEENFFAPMVDEASQSTLDIPYSNNRAISISLDLLIGYSHHRLQNTDYAEEDTSCPDNPVASAERFVTAHLTTCAEEFLAAKRDGAYGDGKVREAAQMLRTQLGIPFSEAQDIVIGLLTKALAQQVIDNA